MGKEVRELGHANTREEWDSKSGQARAAVASAVKRKK